MSRDRLVCYLCGRVGSRGFVQSSGNGDGTHDTYQCANETACHRRALANPLPTDAVGAGPAEATT